MRILHTSDLHLGRTLYGARRDEAWRPYADLMITLVAWILILAGVEVLIVREYLRRKKDVVVIIEDK